MTPPTIQTTAELVEQLEALSDNHREIMGQPVIADTLAEAATRLEHLERALTEARTVLKSQGYGDHTAVITQIDRALTQSGNNR